MARPWERRTPKPTAKVQSVRKSKDRQLRSHDRTTLERNSELQAGSEVPSGPVSVDVLVILDLGAKAECHWVFSLKWAMAEKEAHAKSCWVRSPRLKSSR